MSRKLFVASFKPATDNLREVCTTQKKLLDARKKGAHKITQKLSAHVSQFEYFLTQLNFIPYRKRKSLCLMYNYRFYYEMVRDARDLSHEAAQKHEITHTHVSCLACFSHLTDFSQIDCSPLQRQPHLYRKMY